MESFYVEPGQRFYVEYVTDGITTEYPVPDPTASTEEVSLAINGLAQPPFAAYTVHQGTLRMAHDPIPTGWVVGIRNA